MSIISATAGRGTPVAEYYGGVPAAPSGMRPVASGLPTEVRDPKLCVAPKGDTGELCGANHVKDSPLCTAHKKQWARQANSED